MFSFLLPGLIVLGLIWITSARFARYGKSTQMVATRVVIAAVLWPVFILMNAISAPLLLREFHPLGDEWTPIHWLVVVVALAAAWLGSFNLAITVGGCRDIGSPEGAARSSLPATLILLGSFFVLLYSIYRSLSRPLGEGYLF